MSLALDLPLASPVPTAARLRVVPAPPCAPPFDDEPGGVPFLRLVAVPEEPFVLDESAWFTEDRTPAAELPDARAFTGRLLQGLVEVLAGARSLSQLRMQTSVELYAELAERLQGGSVVRGGRPEPRVVQRVHTQERPEGVVEACATVLRNGKLTAVALRLEGFGGRWLCVDVEGL
ncbi:MAG: Rv3235 family protein [Actinomycetota bacterium]|nr:Rv3235 family protein [Actinomycetota bacterium]